jgi:hypothetical protein
MWFVVKECERGTYTSVAALFSSSGRATSPDLLQSMMELLVLHTATPLVAAKEAWLQAVRRRMPHLIFWITEVTHRSVNCVARPKLT